MTPSAPRINRADRAPPRKKQFSPGRQGGDTPRPGFFTTRLIRGGPRVPARMYLGCPMVPSDDTDAGPIDWCHATDRCRHLQAEVDGKPASIYRVWPGAGPITAADFAFLSADAAWERENQPSGPKANPHDPVDWLTMPPIF